jgi:hypothetical protein
MTHGKEEERIIDIFNDLNKLRLEMLGDEQTLESAKNYKLVLNNFLEQETTPNFLPIVQPNTIIQNL